jgi:CubicO group peptidase (beta-lactamase class C family)
VINLRQGAICLVLAALLCSGTGAWAEDNRNTSSDSHVDLVEQNIQPLVHIIGTKEVQSLHERMSYYNIPGVSIAVIHNGKIDWAKGYGVIEAGSQKPVTNFTLFEAASVSKPITAITTMVLAQKGLLDLDAPIDNYLKSWHVPASTFSARTAPTARQIMCHHAGFNVEFVSGYTKDEAIPSLVQILNGSPPSNTPAVVLTQTPGKNFKYSAGGFLVLQQALIDQSQNEFWSVANNKVFRPLAMRSMSFIQPTMIRPTPGLAKGHGFDGQPTAKRIYPEQSAAGLITTPTDLGLIILEIQDALNDHGKLLKKATAQQILTQQDDKPAIGLGFFLAGKNANLRFSMDGWNYGYTCRMVGFAHRGEGAVVMTNGDNGALMFEVLDAIAKAYGWTMQPMTRKEASAMADETIKMYCGHYKWDKDMEAEVIPLGARMFLHVFNDDRKKMDPFPPAEIYAKSESEFFTNFPTVKIRFDKDKAQHVSTLIYDMDGKEVSAARMP